MAPRMLQVASPASKGVLTVAKIKNIVKKATGSRKTDVQASALLVGTRPMLARIYKGEKLGTVPEDREDIVAALSAHWSL